MSSEPCYSILRAYTYGLPFLNLRGTTNPAFLNNPNGWFVPLKGTQPVPKIAKVVGYHPLGSLFASEEEIAPIARTILETAAKHTPGLIGLDILRIGYEAEPNSPVTLIITVKPYSTTWEKGCLLAQEIIQAVRQRGSDEKCGSDLMDVQCEVYEAELTGRPPNGSCYTAPDAHCSLSYHQ